MAEEFLTYHKFNDEYLAADFAETLTQSGVRCHLVNNTAQFDPSFANNEILKEYLVQIPADKFRKADLILKQFYEKVIEDAPLEYYLFSYSDEELLEIVHFENEWNEYDVALAKKILKDRNVQINFDVIENEKIDKFNIESQKRKVKSWWIGLGYFIAVLGGFGGIIYGYYLKNDRKTLSNGETMFSHDISDRLHGKNIMQIGIFFFIFWFVISLVNSHYR